MALLTGLAIVGGLLSYAGNRQEGDDARERGRHTAKQRRENAGQIVAAGQMAGEEELRKSQMALSRMIAVAASSGASAVDPTVMKLASGITEEGELAAGMQRFNARTDARSEMLRADDEEAYGESSRRASYMRATGSLLSAGYTAFGKK